MIIGKGQYTITDVYDGDSFYRAWADTPDGSVNFSTTDSNRLYMGVYSGREAPGSPSDYQWTKVRGDSAVVAVLSNDSHQIGTDTNGQNGNYSGAQTTLTILRGGDIDTDNWEVSVSTFPEGSIKGTYSASNFTYIVEEMAADEGQVVFQALPKTGSDSPIEKVFSLSKNKQGQAGEDAKSYHLTVNDTAVKKKRLTRELEPEEVVITGNSITGSESSQTEDGYFKIYTQSETAMGRDDYEDAFYDNLLDPEEAYTLSDNMHPLVLTYTSDQPESELTYTFTDLIDVMSFKVYWYKDSGFEKLLDTQTIVVVSDGIDGTSIVDVSEYYLLTASLERPNKSANWKENEPMTPTGDLPYLWNYETVHYSDGSTSDTLPVILAMYSKDGTSLTDVREYYALSSTTDQPAESAFTNELKVTTPEQKYLWNKEVLELTHDDGSITEKVHYAIIGVHGEEGKQGVPGAPGKNGRSQYVHIRYSPNASGNPNTTVPNVNTEYIGLATTFNKTETSQTLPYTSYTWSKYRGEDGEDGPAGMDADDKFTWVKYAEDDKGTNMSNFPEGKKYIGLSFNKLTPEESDNPNDYQWAAMYDEEGMKNVSVADKDKVSGTTLYTDKADDSVVHVEMDGKSYQHAGSGKNLLINETEDILFNSTGSPWHTVEVVEPLKSGVSYTFGIEGELIENSRGWRVWMGPGATTSLGDFSLSKEGYHTRTINLTPEQAKVNDGTFRIYPLSNDTSLRLRAKINKIQLEEGSVVTEYEPPAPSPEYPIEIHSVNDFDVVSSVGGRNLLVGRENGNYALYNNNGNISPSIHKSYEDYDSVTLIDGHQLSTYASEFTTFILEKDKKYTASMYVYSPVKLDLSIKGYSGDVWSTVPANTWTRLNKTIIGTGEKRRLPSLYSRNAEALNHEIFYNRIKLEEGNLTPYSPAPEDTTPDTDHPLIDKVNLSLSEPLRSVGNVHDRLFRDSDGLWKIERNVGEMVLDGSRGWGTVWSVHNNHGAFLLRSFVPTIGASLEKYNFIKSDKFVGVSRDDLAITGSHINKEGIAQGNDYLALRINIDRLGSYDAGAFRNWLRNNPIAVYYYLSDKSYVESLDQELQDKLNNLRSFQDYNYVYTVLSQEASSSVEKNLHPTLHGTFKGGGWYDRWKTQKELDTKPTYEELGDDTSKVVISGGNITAGTIASQNEYSKIDLDDGSFSFGNGSLTWDGGTLRIGKDNSLQSDIDGKATPGYVDGKVDDAERSAKQHADVAAKAEAELAEAEAIEYANNAIGDIEVGGRNLLIQSEFMNGYTFNTGGTVSYTPIKLETADISNKIQITDKRTIALSRRDGTRSSWSANGGLNLDHVVINGYNKDESGIWRQQYRNSLPPVTVSIPESVAYIMISASRGDLYSYKLEYGNKATDWTPAPEDVEAYTDKVSQAKADVAELEAKKYADGKLSDEEQARLDNAKEVLAEAKKYAEQKASTAESNAKAHAEDKDKVVDLANNAKKFINPASYDSNSNSITGYIIIDTPIEHPYMTKLKISGYNYRKNNANIDLDVGFYSYTTTSFVSYDFVSRGSFPIKQVQLGKDSAGRTVIIIGTSTTSYSYPKISVDEALISHRYSPDSYKDGWNIRISTSLSGITNIVNIPGVDTQTDLDSSKTRTDAWSWNNTVEIDGGAIRAKTIRAEAITTNTLDSISADLGTIRAGRILSNDNAIDINLDTGLINLRKPIKILNRPVQTDQDVERAIDGIEVGGRNLLRNSGEEVSNGIYNIARYDLTDEIKEGEEVTLTIWGSLATTKSNFRAYNSGGSVQLTPLTDNGDGTYSSTFKWKIGISNNTHLNIYAFTNAQNGISTINKIKLEKGNKATDWTSAPEDVQAYSDAVAEAKAELAETEAKAYADGKVTAEEQARINDAKAKLAEAKKHADSKASTAETNAKDHAEQQVDDLEVGGRNLILNSHSLEMTGSDNGNRNVNTFDEGVHIIVPSNNGNVYNTQVEPSMELVKGHEYTLSFDVLTNTAIGVYWYADTGGSTYSGGRIPDTKGEWIKHEFTYTQTRDSFSGRFLFGFHNLVAGSEIRYRNLKLEKGNKATDWEEAPEDTHKVIDDKTQAVSKENLAQLDEEISSVRADADASYAKSKDFEAFQTEVTSSFETTNQGFEMNFKENKELISKVGGQLEQLDSEIEKYIRFENGKIKLGAAGSETEIIISNESIDFMQGGGEPVAYIEGQEMKINRGIFVDSATIAGFKFENVSGDPDVLGVTWTS